MVAIAIFTADPALRRRLELLPREDLSLVLAGAVDNPAELLRLAEKHRIDVVLAQAPPREPLPDGQIRHADMAWVAILDHPDIENGLSAISAGASAIVPTSASPQEVIAAIKAAAVGLVSFPREFVAALLNANAVSGEPLEGRVREADARLTPRELEVLAAMADGASNKAIARRLGISFHTVKFHVAAILEKLDADTRTEAVMKAAQQGMVML